MSGDFLKLTNTVYKISEFFPESDPLKNRVKDRALSIMENLSVINENNGWMSFQKEKIKIQVLEDIDILLGYLWIAKSQGWMNSVNFLIIANEYEKIKKDLNSVFEFTQKLPGLDVGPTLKAEKKSIELPKIEHQLTARQDKIIDFLNKNTKAQVMDLKKSLPDVTKRTIRRDLDELLKANKIERMGDFNQVFYQIKG